MYFPEEEYKMDIYFISSLEHSFLELLNVVFTGEKFRNCHGDVTPGCNFQDLD